MPHDAWMQGPSRESDELSTLLVVDDAPENLQILSALLKGRYRVKLANSGERALRLLQDDPLPDLVLLDVMMPGIDGYEVCRRIKGDPRTASLPVVFVTSRTETADEAIGLELGAVDYITKPISPAITLSRIRTHVTMKRAADKERLRGDELEREVRERTESLSALQEATIIAMSSLAEARDNETGNHIRRTQHYVRALASQLRDHPRFSAYLTARQIEVLYKSSPLHDIGKVGIPDHILLKPGRLTADEFEIMKTHTTLGYGALKSAAEHTSGHSGAFLECAAEIALSHQEKWDGSGYPQGLQGKAIPISGRLMAVADVYDALVSRRVYKPPMPHDQAVTIILEGSGSHFDPDIVSAFKAIVGEFAAIATRFRDPT
jgi:putative two-component system response regulator